MSERKCQISVAPTKLSQFNLLRLSRVEKRVDGRAVQQVIKISSSLKIENKELKFRK
jgi:hypothetical protein